jgi:exodeoxyribonuclease V alpha subunit
VWSIFPRKNTRPGSKDSWTAGKFKTQANEIITFAGNVDLRTGTTCKLIGEWINHERWGRQFKVVTFEPDVMTNARGLAKYIADNKNIKGIGAVKARRMVEIYGEKLESVLADSEKRTAIATLLGVPKESIDSLAEEWQRDKHLIASKSWLASFGLTQYQIRSIIDRYGPAAKQVLTDNPYLLIKDIDGWGFKRCDDVALSLGYPKEHPERIRAAIIYVIKQAMSEGNCWINRYSLLEKVNKTLYLDTIDAVKIIEAELGAMITDGSLYFKQYNFINQILALPHVVEVEREIFEFLARGKEENCNFYKFKEYLELNKIPVINQDENLNSKQNWALNFAETFKISVITGGAGTGKTYTLKQIIETYKSVGLTKIACCALAGKAARRIEESTGCEASTIHRLLEFNPQQGGFLRNRHNPIDADLVIIDEFSMVDIFLARDLFEAIDLNHTSVIIVGDHNQLPSIGPGSILRDLCDSSLLPTTILTEMMRQSGELDANSNKILEGIIARKRFRTTDDDPSRGLPWLTLDQCVSADVVISQIRLIAQNTIAAWQDRALLDLQVITPMRKGQTGTNRLNRILQYEFQNRLFNNPINYVDGETPPEILKYDKVIQTRNNYDLDLYNGTLGQVQEIRDNGSIVVNWDDGRTITLKDDEVDDIELAYALTIHKVQGSEFPLVIVVCYKQHSHMLHRNLLYTAVTRAKESCVLIGDTTGFKIAAERTDQNHRNTFLPIFIKENKSLASPA